MAVSKSRDLVLATECYVTAKHSAPFSAYFIKFIAFPHHAVTSAHTVLQNGRQPHAQNSLRRKIHYVTSTPQAPYTNVVSHGRPLRLFGAANIITASCKSLY